MADIMFSLLLWIGDHSQHDIYLRLPNVSQVEQSSICQQYGINTKTECDNRSLIGFYDMDLTIYLPLNYSPETLHQQSQLLHELVHFIQWENMNENESYCLGEKEYEAYQLQNLWRGQNGLEPVSDGFTLMMLAASCED